MAKATEAGGQKYARVIERIFLDRHHPGSTEVDFERADINRVCADLGIEPPKNLGDLVYSLRYRQPLPASICATAAPGHRWVIRSVGRSRYRFAQTAQVDPVPRADLPETKIPDSTPGMVARYAFSDEQALLARLRYNRLLDSFTGVTCYSLQNHLRTTAPGVGQIETDELYVGVDGQGVHYVFPVQAKGGRDRISVVQIEQDVAACSHKLPALVCRPVAAQFMADELIALFEFQVGEAGVSVVSERHYRLVPSAQVTDADLAAYRMRE
jgi:hypothetical protein